MNIRPTNDRVLVKTTRPETISKGGIIIPQTAQSKTLTGTIEGIGPDVPADLFAVGDKVMYDKYGGTEFKENGEDYVLIRYPDILVKIDDE